MSPQLDPVGLVEFVLPPGFGPDLTKSTLQHLTFRHLGQADETLTIQVMPTTATASAEAWFDGVRDHRRGFEWRLVSPRPGSPPYALGERWSDEHSERVHLIRGARFDVALTHHTAQAVAPGTGAAYDLNAALIAARAGASEEALDLLRSALRQAFEGDPTEEVALRILHVAATMLERDDPELAAELDSAALTIVEERRDAIEDDRHRVVFGEATRWHEIHDRLVAHYAERSATQALQIIDRMRGRSLHRDRQPPAPLGVPGPNLDDNPLAAALPDLLPNVIEEFDATVPKPTLNDRDPRDAFRAAARYLLVDAATRRILAGEPKHLSGAEIEHAAVARGATILRSTRSPTAPSC